MHACVIHSTVMYYIGILNSSNSSNCFRFPHIRNIGFTKIPHINHIIILYQLTCNIVCIGEQNVGSESAHLHMVNCNM